MKKRFLNDFLLYGDSGWCMECLWTGMGALLSDKDKQLSCHTSIWMFPIYGMAACLTPVCKKIEKHNSLYRGAIYMFCIYATEYATGTLLKKWNACPWDYSKAKWNYHGVIRLDYAPAWFLAGLYYEQLLKRS